MIVVDASVAVKWFVAEWLHDEARGLLDRPEALVAPDLLPVETANVAWKKLRRGELTAGEASQLVAVLLGGVPALRPSRELLPRALDLAAGLDHAVYDCLYLALALEEQATLVTADHRLHERVAGSDLCGATALLGDS